LNSLNSLNSSNSLNISSRLHPHLG
jgi:hypothetical protein